MFMNNFLRPWFVAVLLCLLYALAVILIYRTPLALVTIGTDFAGEVDGAYSAEGYDGQFVYYIARDPLNAASLIDVPAYRYQRILLPLLAMPFGGSVWALLIIGLVALGAGTAALEAHLRLFNVSRWYALGYALSLGVLGSARLSLPEPLAYGLCAGGAYLIARERHLAGAVLFALAAFAKETALVFAAGYGFHYLLSRDLHRAVTLAAVTLIPFAIWQGVLFAWLGSAGVGSGGAGATGFSPVPFGGVADILLVGGAELFGVFLLLLGPFVLLPTLWGLWRAVRDVRAPNWTLYTTVLLVNAAIMLFVPFSTYREPLGILRFIVGLQLAVILYAGSRRDARTLRNSTLWAVTLLFVVASDIAGPGG